MIKLNVIGDPVMHSKSPLVHGKVLGMLGIDYEYDRVLVKKGGLSEYIKQAVELGVAGFNLTMPHKADIIPFLKEIDSDARLFGAVNTVKIDGGKLSGYNTDAGGFILALSQNGFDVKNKDIVILGAGGVSSTLAVKFASLGAKSITVLNRTAEKAADICEKVESVRSEFGITSQMRYDGFGANIIKKYMPGCDMLLNATPLGMTGVNNNYEDLSFFESLNKSAFVADLIYSPEKTEFLKSAEQFGLKFMNGYGMLIGQAILADEIYLGRKLNVSEIYTKITKQGCAI